MLSHVDEGTSLVVTVPVFAVVEVAVVVGGVGSDDTGTKLGVSDRFSAIEASSI